MAKNKLCLSAIEVAEEIGLSVSMIRKLTNNGEIPHLKIGRRVLYPVSELKNWYTKCIVNPNKGGDNNGT